MTSLSLQRAKPTAQLALPMLVLLAMPQPGHASPAWTETVLHTFDSGWGPQAALMFDAAGNLYGTTAVDGVNGAGTVFQLTPPAAGKTAWSQTVLYAFNSSNGGADGYMPQGGVVMDRAGNLYGTTSSGGPNNGYGTAFELTPPAPGQSGWKKTILCTFSGANGNEPAAGLILDAAGNLYGTTFSGGAHNQGVLYRLAPPPIGQTAWTQTVLHAFAASRADGAAPWSTVIFDAAGNLYGTTSAGGAYGIGTAYKVAPPAPGKTSWTETTLVPMSTRTGATPYAGMTFDARKL